MISLNTNISALRASASLTNANTQVTTSMSRLSSGNQIIQASDDVAGLAVGTILKTNVTALKTALINTAQASSLINVADGALGQIADILNRQKALASQATSGALDDTARGFLNLEFSALTSEIDRLSQSTNFNNIPLIDGSLFNPSKLNTNINANSATANGTLAGVASPAGNLVVTIGAATVTFDFGAVTATNDDALLQIDPASLTTPALTATALMQRINTITSYSGNGSNQTQILAAKQALSGLNVNLDSTGTNLIFTDKSGGTIGNTISFTGGGFTTMTLSGGANGSLTAGTASAVAVNPYLTTTAQVFPQGTISDSIISSINTAGISNNPSFVGNIGSFQAIYESNEVVNLSITVGNYTYQSAGVNTNYNSATSIVLSSVEPGGGFFEINFAANSGMASMTSPQDANTYASRINKAFSTIDIVQKREITSYVPAGTVYPTGGTTPSGNLAGSRVFYIGDNFNTVEIDDIQVTAPATANSNAVIQFTIDNEVYVSGYDYDGYTAKPLSLLAGGANTIDATSGTPYTDPLTGIVYGQLGFVNTTDPTKVLIFQYSNSTALSITSQAEAEGAENALKAAFGVGKKDGGDAGLTFQLGTSASDVITVQIESSQSKDIYLDSNNNYQPLDISTQPNAMIANGIIDSAINQVISIRATVGALQSRIEYASANISSSIENQDAARGIFLDADIAQESTLLAESQVRLQASISVLAQANQISQNLLKLLG